MVEPKIIRMYSQHQKITGQEILCEFFTKTLSKILKKTHLMSDYLKYQFIKIMLIHKYQLKYIYILKKKKKHQVVF